MIYRFLYVGYSTDLQSIRCSCDVNHYVSLSYKDNMVFMYVESNKVTVNPELLADGELIPFPDGQKWERAIEIYHYSKPMNAAQWNRKLENKKPYVTFNRLKPEKTASYIFYHYQQQEERPGGSDRYGNIYLFRDMLIFYHEIPKEPENEYIEGTLKTNHSPIEQWGQLMEEHFADSWHEIHNLDFTPHIAFEGGALE